MFENSAPATASLVSLLGDQRAELVLRLRRAGEATVGMLADHLGISDVATRRHLGVLEDEQLVTSRDVVDGPGRPARHYRLTQRAERLFPQRSADVADELLRFIESTQGREGLRAYLAWRLERQCAELEGQVTGDSLEERLEQLADALSAAGFDAQVERVSERSAERVSERSAERVSERSTPAEAGDRFLLRQEHCAIYDVARDHPEMCAWEAASFSKVLGRDVRLSRQQTRTDGASACVCCITPRDADGPPPERVLPVVEASAPAPPPA